VESIGEQEDTIQAFSGEMKITNHYHKNNSVGKRFKLGISEHGQGMPTSRHLILYYC
jgi:hypothetical protein